MKTSFKFFALIVILAISSSCSKKNIEGIIIDNFDQPIAGVNVTITGSSFQSKTDNSGKYDIEYAPGTINLNFEKDGYISETLSLNISTQVEFPAEKIIMTKKPNGNGVFFVDKKLKDYVLLNQGSIRRDHIYNENSSLFNMETVPNYFNYFYCSGNYTAISTLGNSSNFVINYSDNLNLFRIQRDDGFFYSHEEYGLSSKWSANKPNIRSTLKGNFIICNANLTAGKYCFTAANKNFKYPVDPIFIFEIK
jgi:hypothetical protein